MEQAPKQTRLLWAGVIWLALVFLFGLHLRFEAGAGRSAGSDAPFERLIVDRLVLLGQFSDDLDPEHKARFLQVARALEEDPLRRAALEARNLPTHLQEQLSPSLRAYLDRESEPSAQLRSELATARFRLVTSAVGLGVLGLAVLLGALFGPRPPGGPLLLGTGAPLQVWGVFLLWSFLYLFGGSLLVWPLQAYLGTIWLNMAAQLLGYAALLVLLARWLRGRVRRLWGQLSLGWIGRGYLLALASVFIVNLATAALLGLPPRSNNPVLELLAQASAAELTALILLVTLVGPLFEELIFRGWLQTALAHRYGAPAGVIAAALLFALFHADVLGTPALFTLGLVFGWVYQRSGSLAVPFAVHALWNSTTFGLLWTGLP